MGGDKKLTSGMVPGYTGYIPKKEEHFGTRYAVGCHRAIDDFEKDRGEFSKMNRARFDIIDKPKQDPVREPAPYVSKITNQHSVSPYFMETGDIGKTFMSGYTGFIPYSRSHFANVYPVMTMTALTEFTEDRATKKKQLNKNVDMYSLSRDGARRISTSPASTDKKMAHSIYRNNKAFYHDILGTYQAINTDM